MNSLTKLLMAVLCMTMLSCTKQDNKSRNNTHDITEVISHFSNEGGDSDDPPIVITHLSNPQGVDIESAMVIFVNGQDTVSANPDSGGYYIAYLGEYTVWDMYAEATGYQTLFKPDVVFTDSLNFKFEVLQPE